MTSVLTALLPVFLIIAIGWAIRAARILSAEAFIQVNRLGFFIFYPAVLFTLTVRAEFTPSTGPLLGGVLLGYVLLTFAAFAMRLFARDDGPAFTSMFQGMLRWNGFLLLAAAASLFGPESLNPIGLLFGPLALFNNVVCALVLLRWGELEKKPSGGIWLRFFSNPLILPCILGLIFNVLGWREFGPLSDAMDLLGAAALPVVLLSIGAGLDLRSLRRAGANVLIATTGKLVLVPLVLWACVKLLGGDDYMAWLAVGVGATPTAAAGYTMAVEMGGDAKLMAALVTATTLGAAITMPIAIALSQPG